MNFIDFTKVKQNDFYIQSNAHQYVDNYDTTTTQYYKAYRIKKMDPILFTQLNDKNAFKFYAIWDPLTGARTGIDPYGPLYFNPITIMEYIYKSAKDRLWIDATDDMEGYYTEHVGAGEECMIVGRGTYPEKYLFRLPISDCYLNPDHNMSVITMGPILTDAEIIEIDDLLVKYWKNDNVYKKYYHKIGSLYLLKKYYDVAISKTPLEMGLIDIDIDMDDIMKQHNPNQYLNMCAVNIIKNMY